MQVSEQFFSRPKRTMMKNKGKASSPVLLHEKEARNVYEDSEIENNDVEILKSWDIGSHRYRDDCGRRVEKRRRYNYDSDVERYRSPPPRGREGRRSPPARFTDNSYRRRERPDRLDDGPGSSRVKRERSLTLEEYNHDSRGHSENGRYYE